MSATSDEPWPARLWVVRHGESAGNVARDAAEAAGLPMIDIAERDMDVPLSPLGQRQARALGRWFDALPDHQQPTVVLASPYIRAVQTADLVVAGTSERLRPLVRIVDERLRERELGALDRLTRAGIVARHPDQAELRGRVGKFYYRPPGGESWCDVILRLRSVLEHLQIQYRGERVLVVGHQVIVLCFRYLLERMSEAQILAIDREKDVANCGVTEYERGRDADERVSLLLRTYNFVSPLEDAGEQVTVAPESSGAAMSRRALPPPDRITAALLRRWPLPTPDAHAGKEERGRVLVVGGSDEIPGAVVLAAIGALRAGAGKLQIATAARATTVVAIAVPEARVIALRTARGGELASGSTRSLARGLDRQDAILIGPGMMSATAGIELLRTCRSGRHRATVVVDAAPLAALRTARSSAPLALVVTPHAGEMAAMWGLTREQVVARPLAIAREAAAELGAVVALKGAVTHVVGPDGRAFINTAGNPGLGTSGSGDTLSGIIAGLCARGADPLQAAVWGVHLHARAGDLLAARIGPLGFLAREILGEIPALLARLGPRARRPG